jgi:hypothetical protein
MQPDEVQPRQCYRLTTGQIIRVLRITDHTVECDMYDDKEKKWVQIHSPIDVISLEAPCEEPNRPGRAS